MCELEDRMRFASAVFLLFSGGICAVSGSSICKEADEVPIQGLIPVSNGCSKPPGMSVEGETAAAGRSGRVGGG